MPSNRLKDLYNAADVFVMPNIPVDGDVEGFGLVALEAASCRTPVVAANIEGLRDAVHPEIGELVEQKNPEQFVDAIESVQDKGVREYVVDNCTWRQTAEDYVDCFREGRHD